MKDTVAFSLRTIDNCFIEIDEIKSQIKLSLRKKTFDEIKDTFNTNQSILD